MNDALLFEVCDEQSPSVFKLLPSGMNRQRLYFWSATGGPDELLSDWEMDQENTCRFYREVHSQYEKIHRIYEDIGIPYPVIKCFPVAAKFVEDAMNYLDVYFSEALPRYKPMIPLFVIISVASILVYHLKPVEEGFSLTEDAKSDCRYFALRMFQRLLTEGRMIYFQVRELVDKNGAGLYVAQGHFHIINDTLPEPIYSQYDGVSDEYVLGAYFMRHYHRAPNTQQLESYELPFWSKMAGLSPHMTGKLQSDLFQRYFSTMRCNSGLTHPIYAYHIPEYLEKRVVELAEEHEIDDEIICMAAGAFFLLEVIVRGFGEAELFSSNARLNQVSALFDLVYTNEQGHHIIRWTALELLKTSCFIKRYLQDLEMSPRSHSVLPGVTLTSDDFRNIKSWVAKNLLQRRVFKDAATVVCFYGSRQVQELQRIQLEPSIRSIKATKLLARVFDLYKWYARACGNPEPREGKIIKCHYVHDGVERKVKAYPLGQELYSLPPGFQPHLRLRQETRDILDIL